MHSNRYIVPSLPPEYQTQSRITSYLYVTSFQGAEDLQQLEQHQIGFIVNVCKTNHSPAILFDYKVLGIEYVWFPMRDEPNEHLIEYAERINQCINNYRIANPDRGILIHCIAGISRSVSVAIYHLMETWHLPFNQVYNLVQHARPFIHPNEGFRASLSRLNIQ